MQRYEDLNLKIHSLELQMGRECDSSLATELIVRALRLGAVYLDLYLFKSSFVLPDEVLQSETLTGLFVRGCTVGLRRRNIIYSKLKSLDISWATVINGDLVRDLILRCPLIEGLTLRVTDCRIKLSEFHNHEYKYLDCFDVRESVHKHGLWPKLAHLKELVIWPLDCRSYYNWRGARICSPSLERIVIRLSPHVILRAEFDVPNLRRFEFHGSALSHLHFEAASCRKWESDLHILCYPHMLATSWLSSLDQLVGMLSDVSVHILVRAWDRHVWEEVAACLATPLVVESLTLEGPQVSSAFLDSLFSTFCPKFIIQGCDARDAINEYLVDLVCKRVLEEVNEGPWEDDKYGVKIVRFQLRWGHQ